MAKEVIGKVLGGDPQTFSDVRTVEDVKHKLKLNGANYTAAINGDPAELSDRVNDYDQVTFSPAVKGGKN